MTAYRYFQDALRDYRSCGGAMLYVPKARSWTVCTFAVVAVRTELTPLEATRQALSAGGFTAEQVSAELAGWV